VDKGPVRWMLAEMCRGSLIRGALMLAAIVSCGCYAATRSTVRMVEANQKMTEARGAGAPARAVYAWTKADEYMKKARDEWARSEFQSAEKMLDKAKEWATEATRLARSVGPADVLDVVPEQVPVPSVPADTDDDEGVW